MTKIIIDTGPIVAFLNGRDRHHGWVRGVLAELRPPLYTCESVISEACFLVRNLPGGPGAVLELLARHVVAIDFDVPAEVDAVRKLMVEYANVPMSLADACLVRMTELERDSSVLTMDSDFRLYRRNRRQVVPVTMPD